MKKQLKEIRDKKVVEMDLNIEKKESVIIRSIKSHEDGLIMLQEELDLEIMLRNALNSLK